MLFYGAALPLSRKTLDFGPPLNGTRVQMQTPRAK
jgi:hypothetical protein